MTKLHALVADARGAVTIEFAIYLMVFLGMIVGGVNASMLGYANSNLKMATESAARCRAMNTSCTSNALAQTHALGKFSGYNGATPVFVASSQTCGYQVVGTMTVPVSYILGTKNFNLRAASCFANS